MAWVAADNPDNNNDKNEFSVGDHIFRWCSYLGVPFAFQQHAIALAVEKKNDDDDDGEDDSILVIMNFDHQEEEEEASGSSKDKEEKEDQDQPEQNQQDTLKITGSVSTSTDNDRDTDDTENKPTTDNRNNAEKESMSDETNENDKETNTGATISCSNMMKIQKISRKKAHEAPYSWERVQYSQPWQHRLLSRAGTCSDRTPDPVPVILARVHFLRHFPTRNNFLSDLMYHSHKSNGECLARWCILTGDYASTQGSAKMGEVGMHVGSLSVVGGIASQVVVSALVPAVLPFLAAWDVGHAVYSAKEVHATRQEWQERSELWDKLFLEFLEQHQKDSTAT